MFLLKFFLLLFFNIGIFFSASSQIHYFKNAKGVRLYPQSHQLYPRDVEDKALVEIQGQLTGGLIVDSIELAVSKHFLDGQYTTAYYQLKNKNDSFHFMPIIEAGMYLYSFQITLKHQQQPVYTENIAQQVVCGDVYIVSGQSNAMGAVQGLPQVGWNQDRLYQQYPQADSQAIYSKSLGNMPWYNGQHGALTNYDPNNNNWLPARASDSMLLGFVGIWALKLQHLIQHYYKMPTCFINGAYGGTTLSQHQRYASPNNDPLDLSTLFGALTYRIEQANVKHTIKGVIWYQGESQNSYELAHSYADSLNHLIDDWEQHWGNIPKVYVVQIHPGCNYHGFGQVVREQQRSIKRPQQHAQQIVPLTASGIGARALAIHDPYSSCHFSQEAYNNLSERLFQLIGRDFYHASQCITSPNILNATYTEHELVLEFDQTLAALPEGIANSFEFYKNNVALPSTTADFNHAYTQQNKLYIPIQGVIPDAVSYLLVDDPVYQQKMIWLSNPQGYAAFSFHQFPIKTQACSAHKLSLATNVLTQRNLEVTIKGCSMEQQIFIHTAQGQLVYQQALSSLNTSLKINLEHVAQGIYFLSLSQQGTILETQKFILH